MPKRFHTIHTADGELERKRKAAEREIAVAREVPRALRLIRAYRNCLSLNGPRNRANTYRQSRHVTHLTKLRNQHASCAAEHRFKHRSYLDR